MLPNRLHMDNQLDQSTSGTAIQEMDTAGDFFGNYKDYSLQELGLGTEDDLQLDQDMEMGDVADFLPDVEDVEDALLESLLAEEENGLEPQRANVDVKNLNDDEGPVNTAVNTARPSRLRGGAEETLQKRPFVVKFQKGHAGAIYNQEAQNENGRYEEAVGDPENPYAPFRSQLEWGIARWAKLRGSSSTAFTELMSIDGVSKMT